MRHPGKAKWDANNRDKRRAQKTVENALVWGRMTRKPCERCGADKAHAHHENYSKPLEVMWLCPKHHRQRHADINAIHRVAVKIFGG
jgi:hypothetical protein